MVNPTSAIIVVCMTITGVASEPLKCFVCKDCPEIGIDQLKYLEHCSPESGKVGFSPKAAHPVTDARISYLTNEVTPPSKMRLSPGMSATNMVVCYILRLEVDDGIKVSRGCTLYVDSKNVTCTKLATEGKRADCTLCALDQCNGAIKNKDVILNLIAVAIHVLLSVCHNKFR